MINDRSRNSGPKRRTRDYAHEHGLTYQQALHLLRGVDNPQRQPRPAIPVGSQILIHHQAHSANRADYTLAAELTWKPFTDDISSCVFLAPHYQLTTGTLCHQLAINPALPVESFLIISACGIEEYDETRWIAEGPRRGAWNFQQFLMANEEVGYAQAGAAADALADFQPSPGRMGIVVVTMSDPYEWAEPTSVGPHWCESYYRPQPGRAADFGATKHVLSDLERRDYTRFLRELERLLHRATADRIVVLFSIEDNRWDSTELLSRCGVQRFGTRVFNGVHTEYDNAPAITDPELFQAMFPEVDLPQPPPPDDRYFWSGMEPKDGRIAYAHLPGSAAPGLDVMLLQDPPITPTYWAGSYEEINGGRG